MTRKAPNLPIEKARALALDYAKLNVVTLQPHHVINAIDLKSKFQIGFWGALILVAAKAARASILFTDLSAGQVYDGVVAKNSFLESGSG